MEKDGEQVNGKSIMGLMMLAAGQGSKLRVTAEGPDAEKAIEDIETLGAGALRRIMGMPPDAGSPSTPEWR